MLNHELPQSLNIFEGTPVEQTIAQNDLLLATPRGAVRRKIFNFHISEFAGSPEDLVTLYPTIDADFSGSFAHFLYWSKLQSNGSTNAEHIISAYISAVAGIGERYQNHYFNDAMMDPYVIGRVLDAFHVPVRIDVINEVAKTNPEAAKQLELDRQNWVLGVIE